MSDNYYSYKTEKYSCRHCGWIGFGKDAEQGEIFKDGFEVDCPKCHERLPGLILFPTIEETLEKGTEADKRAANASKSFREKWLSSLVTDVNQLPDLHGDLMAFVLREIEEEGEKYIIITEQNKIILKEILAYEYYNRFIEIGKLLKQKYGDNMIDLVPDVDGYYLYGDSIHSYNLIKKFRKRLRSDRSND
jgi:hypothetical protein